LSGLKANRERSARPNPDAHLYAQPGARLANPSSACFHGSVRNKRASSVLVERDIGNGGRLSGGVRDQRLKFLKIRGDAMDASHLKGVDLEH
jgi:hypothetical protein